MFYHITVGLYRSCARVLYILKIYGNLQAARIAPVNNNGNSSRYPDFTFDLSFGSSEASTLVTVPSDTLSKLAERSSSNSPILYATVVGGRLSLTSNQNTSQVFWIRWT